MNAQQQLDKVLENSRRIPFDNDDRLVFFSDLHRGNNTWADEFARNQVIYSHAIKHYYDAGFTYIEVGDGDELMKFKNVETIRLAHEDVYRLLQKFHRAGRLYYIYGNHDIDYRNPVLLARKLNRHFNWHMDKEEILFENFSVHEGLRFVHKESGVEVFVTHGHQVEGWHRFPWLNRWLLRSLWRPLQLLGLQDPMSASQNRFKRQKVEQRLIEWVQRSGYPLICGHTHEERFPKKHEPAYFNTGSCVHPRWITAIEIKQGEIALVRWRIKPRQKGNLFVKRDVIGGPAKLKHFAR